LRPDAGTAKVSRWIGDPLRYFFERDSEEARAVFLAFVDKGTLGVRAALAGTPYA
jgi:hypothetical protein